MINRSRSIRALAATLATSLVTAAPALADPLPVSPPELPGSPSVGVTPGDNGAGVDIGVGGTGVQLGVGPGGVSLGLGSGPTTPSPGASKTEPKVRTPSFTPTKTAKPDGSREGGRGGGSAGKKASTGSGKDGARTRAKGESTSERILPTRHAEPVAAIVREAADRKADSKLTPVLEFVDRIPAAFKAALVALGLIALGLWAVWVRDRRRLSGNAFVDPVTGIANAVAFTRLLDRELERARRYKRPLGILLLDVSEAEHEEGKLLHLRDTTLREASGAISARIREADTAARLGDSRFAVMSPEATAASTETLARALELRLEELRIHVKVGVAEREATDQSAADLLVRAEAAMPDRHADRPQVRASRVLRAA